MSDIKKKLREKTFFVHAKDDNGQYQPYGILSLMEAVKVAYLEHRAVHLMPLEPPRPSVSQDFQKKGEDNGTTGGHN